MAMLDLLEETDDETYAGLLPAFRRGYEALLAWPDDPIEPLQVGRILWKMNYVAGIQAQRLPQLVERLQGAAPGLRTNGPAGETANRLTR